MSSTSLPQGVSLPQIPVSWPPGFALPADIGDAQNAHCWNTIGVYGNGTCPQLATVVHCHNCPIFSHAGKLLFDREPPPEVLNERSTLAALPELPAQEALQSALLFRLGAEWLVLDAMSIVEVAEPRLVRRIPTRSDSIFLGLVNIRGELKLAFDLRQMLTIPAVTADAERAERLVIIRLEGQTWAFPADEVLAIIRFSATQEFPVPATLDRWKSTLVKSIVSWEGKMAGLMDPCLLLSRLNQHIG